MRCKDSENRMHKAKFMVLLFYFSVFCIDLLQADIASGAQRGGVGYLLVELFQRFQAYAVECFSATHFVSLPVGASVFFVLQVEDVAV